MTRRKTIGQIYSVIIFTTECNSWYVWYCFRYALVLIAMYNVWDLIGRYIPLLKCLKLESRKLITITILSRFLLVPAFYFTAKYGDQGWMIVLTSFLGLSNGYLTVCVLTSAPKGYKVSLISVKYEKLLGNFRSSYSQLIFVWHMIDRVLLILFRKLKYMSMSYKNWLGS